MPDPLYLIDGTLFFFRGYFGVPERFEDAAGRRVHGVLGYARFLRNLLRDRRVGRALVAFDESLDSSFRNEHFPDYKANRAPADADIAFQLEACQALTRLFGVAVASDARYEADDIIATVASREPGPTYVVTRDKDLKQLVGDSVRWWDGADVEIDAASFRAEYGFEPALFPDYQALVGDKVDNVPGVPGVGVKTAGRLVARYGGLEALRAAAADADFPGPGVARAAHVRDQLRRHWDQAFAMRSVLRLATDAPVATGSGGLDVGGVRMDALARYAGSLGLARHLGLEAGVG